MSIFAILKTPKGGDKATFVGQVSGESLDIKKASEIATKVTNGESKQGIRCCDGEVATVTTSGHHVDFLDKAIMAEFLAKKV